MLGNAGNAQFDLERRRIEIGAENPGKRTLAEALRTADSSADSLERVSWNNVHVPKRAGLEADGDGSTNTLVAIYEYEEDQLAFPDGKAGDLRA